MEEQILLFKLKNPKLRTKQFYEMCSILAGLFDEYEIVELRNNVLTLQIKFQRDVTLMLFPSYKYHILGTGYNYQNDYVQKTMLYRWIEGVKTKFLLDDLV